MNRKFNILLVYNILLTLVVVFILIYNLKLKNSKIRFKEVFVERINVVEKDGKPKLIITNKELQPTGLAINGKNYEYGRGKSGGMLLYNDLGEECGGFLFGGDQEEHGLILSFDQFKQDQLIDIRSTEMYRNGKKEKLAGLAVWNRPDTIDIEDVLKEDERISKIEDEALREKEYEKLEEMGFYGGNIFFAGKLWDIGTGIFIKDSKGNSRIKLYVDADDNPVFELYNKEGKTIPLNTLVK